MSDYISREAASAVIEGEQKKLCPVGLWGRKFAADADKYDMLQEMLDKLEAIPAADVEPVRMGQWERCFEDWRQQIEGDKCSACGFEYYGTGIRRFHYCPNCGAKMELEDENNDD